MIYYINWSALWGFLLLRKAISPHVRNCDNFCLCLRTQTELLTGYSVYSGPLMNANMFSFWNMNLCKLTCYCEWGVNVINNIIHGWLGIWNFFSHVQCDISLVICPHLWDNELTTQREIPCLRVPVYSSQYNTYRIIHGLV